MDAILVGVGTVLADDPLLTARGVPLRRRAIRVVLDGSLRIPLSAKLVASARTTPTLILTSHQAVNTKKAQQLTRQGVELVTCKTRSGRLVLGDCLSRLAELGVTNLLVEGGPTVLRAMLKARLVDEAWLFLAPKIIGGRSQAHALLSIPAFGNPRSVVVQRSGEDLHIRVRLTDPRRGNYEV